MESQDSHRRRPSRNRRFPASNIKTFLDSILRIEWTSASFFAFAGSAQNWTSISSNRCQRPIQGHILIKCCCNLQQYSLQIPYHLWYNNWKMQSLTAFRCRHRGRGCSRSVSLTGSSCSGSVTSQNGAETNTSLQKPKVAQRNLRAAVPFDSPMESGSKPPLLPVTQSNQKDAVGVLDNIQLERFGDVLCDKNKPFSVLNDFTKRGLIAESDLSCIKEEVKSLVEKIKLQEATIRDLQEKKQSFKILLEEQAPPLVEKKWKGKKVLFSSPKVESVQIASTVVNIVSKLCAKEKCELDPFSLKTKKALRAKERKGPYR